MYAIDHLQYASSLILPLPPFRFTSRVQYKDMGDMGQPIRHRIMEFGHFYNTKKRSQRRK